MNCDRHHAKLDINIIHAYEKTPIVYELAANEWLGKISILTSLNSKLCQFSLVFYRKPVSDIHD